MARSSQPDEVTFHHGRGCARDTGGLAGHKQTGHGRLTVFVELGYPPTAARLEPERRAATWANSMLGTKPKLTQIASTGIVSVLPGMGNRTHPARP